MRSNEQKLVDLCFQITLTLHSNKEYFKDKTQEETATWVAEQLRGCGFDTSPCGMCWGVLKKGEG